MLQLLACSRAIDEARSHQAAMYETFRTRAVSVPQLISGGYPNLLELSYGQTLLKHSEQLAHYNGWSYVAITRIATRVAGQKVMMGRKAEGATSGFSWALDRPPGRKVGVLERARAPEYVKAAALDTDIERIESHPLLDVMADPNPLMVTWSLLFHTICSLLITGKAYWWFVKPDKKSDMEVWPIPADWVIPIHDEGLNSHYRIRAPGDTSEGQLVEGDEMAYFSLPDPSSPIGAVSPLQTQAPAIAVDEQIQVSQHRYFKNSAFFGTVIRAGRLPSMTGVGEGPMVVLSEEQKRQLYQAISRNYVGAVNYNQPLIVDGGLISGVERLNMSQQELDFLQSGNVVKSRIFQAFGVNPIVAGEIAGVNRAQAAVADALFVANTVNPLCTMIGQVMTKYIGEPNVYWWIELAKTNDAEQRLREWQTGAQYGCVTKNEIRQQILELPPTEDGDEYVGQQQGGGGFGGMFGPPEAETRKPPGGESGGETPATEGSKIKPKPGQENVQDAGVPPSTRPSPEEGGKFYKYSEDQPREPAGSSTGGQFASEGGGSGGGESRSRTGGETSGERTYTRFSGGDDAEKALATGNVSEGDRKVLRQYVGTPKSYTLNKSLRKGKLNDSQKERAEQLRQVIEKHKIARDVEVARNIVPETAEERKRILASFASNVGKTFTDPAFVSTSANTEYAKSWGRFTPSGLDPIEVRISVPKGAKAMYVEKGIGKRQEWEVLIQAGTSFRVKEADVNSRHVVLEIVQ